MKRVPIAVARRVAQETGAKQVILSLWDGEQLHRGQSMNEWDVKQKQMSEWVEHNLGKGAMDPTERATRFLEEAIELAQAVDVPYRTVRTLTSHVYRKPRGDAAQEIGGVATTMLSLCESLHKQFAAEADREIERIHRLPPEKFRQRQALNAASGIGKPSDKP